MKSRFSSALLLVAVAAASAPAAALEYRSVEAGAAVLFDAPSQKGKKLYIVRKYTPLEVVVSIEGWVKVREPEGSLGWIERKALSEKRTVVVTAARAEVRQAADDSATLVFEAEKGVALELLEPLKDGWVKVRHLDGQSGYVRAAQVWGL